ncbi:crossover junction endodeoxyribonuclease RuvC, partial [bacterium]|nr:crossover junction endodeoxyribonuclease RuvC [bacterium]
IRQYAPDEAAVEELFFSRNVKTAVDVGQARGVVILTCAQAEIEIAEYKPVEIKMAVTGYGAAPKTQIQSMVKMLLGLKTVPRPDDAADALAVAICHAHSRASRKLALQ